MRLHYVAAASVLILALFFKLSKVEVVLLFFTISLVIAAEMFNTAIETVVDMVTRDYHPLAAVAKNVAAGAVLVASLNAVVVGYLLFVDRIGQAIPRVYQRLVELPPYLTFVALVLVVLGVIVGKVRSRSSSLLQGGMPSGHAAVAFSAATAVFFLSRNGLVVTLAYGLALLVAQSRVEARVHNVWETAAGALLGFLLTVAVFQLYRL